MLKIDEEKNSVEPVHNTCSSNDCSLEGWIDTDETLHSCCICSENVQ